MPRLPLTIGREEGNPIQLNDERISRFHLKIQEDQHKIVLTDLQSTNGTKVNGESVQLWVLRPGDVIALGRTILVYGSREEIAERLAALREGESRRASRSTPTNTRRRRARPSLDFELNFADDADAREILHTLAPPDLPEGLSTGQAAQLAEMLLYINVRMRGLIQSVESKGQGRSGDAGTTPVAEPRRPARPLGRLSPPDRRAERMTDWRRAGASITVV